MVPKPKAFCLWSPFQHKATCNYYLQPLSRYSWLLNNMSFNCMRPLTFGYFSSWPMQFKPTLLECQLCGWDLHMLRPNVVTCRFSGAATLPVVKGQQYMKECKDLFGMILEFAYCLQFYVGNETDTSVRWHKRSTKVLGIQSTCLLSLLTLFSKEILPNCTWRKWEYL